MDEATVEILIRAKNEAGAAMTEAREFAERLKGAIEAITRAQAEGATVAEAYKRVMRETAEQMILGGATVEEMKHQVRELNTALRHFEEAELSGLPIQAAFDAALGIQAATAESAASAMDEDTVATTTNKTAKNALFSAITGLVTGGGWPALIAVVAAASVAFFPFAAIVGSAAVALVSFTVGLAGFLAVAGGAAAIFGAIGAAVLALGIHEMGGTGAQANLDKATAQLQKAQQALALFKAQHPGGTSVTALTPAQVLEQQHLQQQLTAAEASGNAQRIANAQYALEHFNLLHPVGQRRGGLTAAQQLEEQKLLKNLTDAQQAYNAAVAASNSPISQFISDAKDVIDVLGKAAAPIAALIIDFADGLLPGVQDVGLALIKWFGERVPAALRGVRQLITDLTPDFRQFATFLGNTFDSLGGKGMLQTFEGLVRTMLIPAVEGLITNLVRLSNWFISELPTLGPIVQQIFGELGNWIQYVASHWSDLTDFVENKWPATVKNAQNLLSGLNQFWSENGKTITTFTNNLVILMGDFNTFMGVVNNVLVPLYQLLTILNATPTAFLNQLNAIVSKLEDLWGYVQKITDAAGSKPSQPGTSMHGHAGQAKVTIHVNGAQSPISTANTIARRLTTS